MKKGDQVIHGNFFGQSAFADYALVEESNVVKVSPWIRQMTPVINTSPVTGLAKLFMRVLQEFRTITLYERMMLLTIIMRRHNLLIYKKQT